MLLTIANVICIQIVGVLTLKVKKITERVYHQLPSYAVLILLFQIKEVASQTTQNQHHLWDHDIKVARDYNTSNGQQSTARQLVEENITEMRKNQEQVKRLYRQPYQHSWLSMNSIPIYGHDVGDLEGITLCMEYPTKMSTSGQFISQPKKNPNTKSRSSVPYASKSTKPRSPSIFGDLQAMSRFRLEKIPEVPTNEPDDCNPDTNHSTDSSTNSDNSQNALIKSEDAN